MLSTVLMFLLNSFLVGEFFRTFERNVLYYDQFAHPRMRAILLGIMFCSFFNFTLGSAMMFLLALLMNAVIHLLLLWKKRKIRQREMRQRKKQKDLP